MYVLHRSSSPSSLRSCHNNQSDYSATIKGYLCTAMPPAVKPSPYQKVHMGSVTRAVILVHDLHTKLRQALKSAQELTQKNWRTVLHPLTPLSRTSGH